MLQQYAKNKLKWTDEIPFFAFDVENFHLNIGQFFNIDQRQVFSIITREYNIRSLASFSRFHTYDCITLAKWQMWVDLFSSNSKKTICTKLEKNLYNSSQIYSFFSLINDSDFVMNTNRKNMNNFTMHSIPKRYTLLKINFWEILCWKLELMINKNT